VGNGASNIDSHPHASAPWCAGGCRRSRAGARAAPARRHDAHPEQEHPLSTQHPSVGDRVHYVSRGSADGVYPPACRAATVTEVGAWIRVGTTPDPAPRGENGRLTRYVEEQFYPDAVGLHVTNPTGVFLAPGVKRDPGRGLAQQGDKTCRHEHTPGSWHRAVTA
jgi:hypothetical protein